MEVRTVSWRCTSVPKILATSSRLTCTCELRRATALKSLLASLVHGLQDPRPVLDQVRQQTRAFILAQLLQVDRRLATECQPCAQLRGQVTLPMAVNGVAAHTKALDDYFGRHAPGDRKVDLVGFLV